MDRVEVFANERATYYDDFVTKWISGYHYFMEILPKVLMDVDGNKMLVAGCGTGNEVVTLLQADKQWQITGVDPSPDMLAQARDKLTDYSLAKDRVKLVEGVVADLAKENKFDVATLLLVLHFFADDGSKLALLQDISDRLAMGATFVMFDITGNSEQMQQNLQTLKKLLPKDIDPVEVDLRLDRMANALHPISEQRLAELFVQAGFEKPQRFFQSSIYMGWLAKKVS